MNTNSKRAFVALVASCLLLAGCATPPPAPTPTKPVVAVASPSPTTSPSPVDPRVALKKALLAEPKNEKAFEEVTKLIPDSRERIDFFRALTKEAPTEPYFLLLLARTYRSAERIPLAILQYRKYLAENKDKAIFLELAEMCEKAGKTKEAEKARKAASEL